MRLSFMDFVVLFLIFWRSNFEIGAIIHAGENHPNLPTAYSPQGSQRISFVDAKHPTAMPGNVCKGRHQPPPKSRFFGKSLTRFFLVAFLANEILCRYCNLMVVLWFHPPQPAISNFPKGQIRPASPFRGPANPPRIGTCLILGIGFRGPTLFDARQRAKCARNRACGAARDEMSWLAN